MSAQEGEWEVGEDSSNAGCAFIPVIRASDGWTICEIYADIELGFTEEDRERARLIAAAPDHALVGWAMCVQSATWEEWGTGKGEFCFAGLRHATTLDEFGVPVLTDNLRTLLVAAKAGGQHG